MTLLRFLNLLAKIRWWLLLGMIALAPFHAFLITWLKIPGLAVWREALVFLIFILVTLELILKKEKPKFDVLDWLILTYVLLTLLWLLFQLRSPAQWLLGFRYDALLFVFFFILRRVPWENAKWLWRTFFASAAVVLIFGLAHALFLPQDFLAHFGYSMYQGEFRPELGVSACQYLEHTNSVCRAISTFGGPTRYGTYLLLIVGMLAAVRWKNVPPTPLLGNLFHSVRPVTGCGGQAPPALKLRRAGKYLGLMFMVLTSIILTFSRSIWIGALAMGIFAFFWLTPRQVKLKIALGAAMIAIVLGAGWFFSKTWQGKQTWPPPLLKTILVRESSTDKHLKLIKEGVALAIKHPLGMGLGTAGPASVRFQKLLTENWYLQIAIETGFLGIALFMAILAALSKKLLSDRQNFANFGLFLSLLGIAVAGLFTHSFEETTTMLLLMGFAGIYLVDIKASNKLY